MMRSDHRRRAMGVPGFCVLWSLAAAANALSAASTSPAYTLQDWTTRFAFVPLEASMAGVRTGAGLGLPSFTITPVASGRQLVRVSLPFAPGEFPAELSLGVKAGEREVVPDLRVLTYHPGRPRSVRRAIITFPYEFAAVSPCRFHLALTQPGADNSPVSARLETIRERIGDTEIRLSESTIEVRRRGQSAWRAELIAPALRSGDAATTELIEKGRHYLWLRLLVPDGRWPRIIEVRADSLGTVAVRAHVQRLEPGDGFAPDLGWRIAGRAVKSVRSGESEQALAAEPFKHNFGTGKPAAVSTTAGTLTFPDAPQKRRGSLDVRNAGNGSETTYVRCRAADRVPHQEAAWREATFVLSPSDAAPWNVLLEPPHKIEIPAEHFDALYGCGRQTDLAPWRVLGALRQYHRDATAASTLYGDDFGNITSFPAGAFGMNRLNHCPPMFEEYYRCGDARLREAALLWCGNFHDLSIWWGTGRPGEFGGTRYNNVSAHSDAHKEDKTYMWRSNTAVGFCTKGYDSFLYAYEETGDPRMAVALRWQIDYAKRNVHANAGECRNIGDVVDFVRLYRFTGRDEYLDEALRLFRELRERLSEGDLFSQGGQPIEKDPPFIDDDEGGYKHPFAKPYIIGYALAGLPELARHAPEEPKLRDVIRAVADFLADSQDPAGGWRYPHPRSSRLLASQAVEHAAQLVRAAAYLEDRGEPIEKLLDAIESVLAARTLAWKRTGRIYGGLDGWERSTGLVKDANSICSLYAKPADRDAARDYTDGTISLGGSPPEGIVYLSKVLDFYLAHRPAERLFHANAALQAVLTRMPQNPPTPLSTQAAAPGAPPTGTTYARFGMADGLPTFAPAQVRRLTFPLAFDPSAGMDFARWRTAAREELLRCLLTPPPRVAFEPTIVATEGRGSYVARKIAFSVSGFCRVPAYVLIPKGKGPFPAVIALHDHGAHFSIGKEKVVRPFDEKQEVLDDAAKWAQTLYGGRFIGDEMAKRGYVVFAMDALFWGDRGRREGAEYQAQQQLAANLFQLGMTWVGVVTWDDIRSAEFVASLPEVDPKRIGAIGLSMGGHRTWMLCAASDRIAAGAAICWMATTPSLMAPGNNQTKGQSAYSMLVPDLRNWLDYADVAAIACPKRMLFFNGEKDALFPVQGVKDAYARMRRVWENQHGGDRLVTKLWPVPHLFNVEMQAEAFAWLDRQLRPNRHSQSGSGRSQYGSQMPSPYQPFASHTSMSPQSQSGSR